MARVTWFGIDMADTMRTRVLAALRGTYPTLTAGATDLRAAELVLIQWVTDMVASWERTQAGDPDAAAATARDSAVAACLAAADQAIIDVTADLSPIDT